MNEKEFNLAILKELRKIAGKVFAKVTVSKEGTYTAAELWDEKDAFGESIVIDYICFSESLLDAILPKLIKAGRGVLTCDIIEDVPEDYPPEPYNKEKSENVATSYERFQDRTICGRFQKNMCPNYLRQKVFPTESFQARRKINQFKPRHFVGRTNHHIYEENSLERKINGNKCVYRVLIRGET